ncbi:MAG: hypothetical protein PHV02_10335 [Rhodocyclaceae bacterium]|nr:hypothetical protein [Rhodocyclaceae bacterium]
MSQVVTYRKYLCPVCKQKTGVKILYGMPSHEAFELESQGLLALGGCCIDINDPERKCLHCGHEWQIKHKPPKFDLKLAPQYLQTKG